MKKNQIKCSKCGECCKYLSFIIPNLENAPEEIKNIYLKRGFVSIKVEGLSNNRLLREYYKAKELKKSGDYITVPNLIHSYINKNNVIIKHICPKLDTSTNLCTIWGKHPILCKRFNGQKGYFIPEKCVWHTS